MGDDLVIDTLNRHCVGGKGGKVVVVMPPTRPLTPAEAKTFAAWLVTMSEAIEEGRPFSEYLTAVEHGR